MDKKEFKKYEDEIFKMLMQINVEEFVKYLLKLNEFYVINRLESGSSVSPEEFSAQRTLIFRLNDYRSRQASQPEEK